MEYENKNEGVLNYGINSKEIPSNLKTITTLTIIACAYTYLSSIYSFFTACNKTNDLEKIQDAKAQGGFLGDFMTVIEEMTISACDNKLIILIATLICTTLCLYGALQMRKLKKNGFPIYVVGELLLPIFSSIILFGGKYLFIFLGASLLIPIVFMALYIAQRKHFIN